MTGKHVQQCSNLKVTGIQERTRGRVFCWFFFSLDTHQIGGQYFWCGTYKQGHARISRVTTTCCQKYYGQWRAILQCISTNSFLSYTPLNAKKDLVRCIFSNGWLWSCSVSDWAVLNWPSKLAVVDQYYSDNKCQNTAIPFGQNSLYPPAYFIFPFFKDLSETKCWQY